jgi:NTE family protein
MVFENGDEQKVGIALSGGGSRAMAFHLGCLRTLHRLGILQKARVLCTVSGGSVIGGMYAVHEGTFEAFESRVRSVLATGFVRPAIRTVFTTTEGLKAVLSFLLQVATWVWLKPFQVIAWIFSWVAIGGAHGEVGVAPEKWSPRRFASTTTILRRTFDKVLFQGRTLGSLPSDRPKLVALAAELRTGSAFYYSGNEAGSWRFGKMDPTQVPVAHAIAASAAYPLFLPALDEYMTFRKKDGSLSTERVTLADGGVYDNLGLSPLWPDRARSVSIVVEEVDTIVACKAGYGLRLGSPSLFLLARMNAAFSCVHNRAQNGSVTRLYDLKAAGRIKNFVLPFLDQDDENLKFAPPDLVRRAAVADYPTDFSAMPSEWIEKLSKRGEQLTLAVIREHAPELLPPGFEEGGDHNTQSPHASLPVATEPQQVP